ILYLERIPPHHTKIDSVVIFLSGNKVRNSSMFLNTDDSRLSIPPHKSQINFLPVLFSANHPLQFRHCIPFLSSLNSYLGRRLDSGREVRNDSNFSVSL